MEEPPQLRGTLTRLVVRLAVPDWRHPERSGVALRLAILSMTIAVGVNALLMGLKLGFGLWVGSLALVADALDTLGDVLLDLVGLVALRVSLRAPDPEHPYGHERAEEIASLAVATVLVVVGLEFGFEAGRRLVTGDVGDRFSVAATAVALGSVLGKLAISRFAAHIAAYTRSPLVEASAWHNATDVFTGLLAAAALVGRRYGYAILDPLFAVIIAALIVYVGARIFRQASSALVGRGGTPKHLDEIHRVACGQPGVLGCSDIEVHWYGRKRRVSLRVQVPDTLSIGEGHAIAARVERALHGLHADWEPVVHVDPVRAPEERPATCRIEGG